ncbi:MAG: SDR family oxidoreductase [Clostridiales bacterium]|nr:SDR family oxidoreductase [Clostridiales bacterium]
MDLGLKDRVVIVTGAASGIGKAIAVAYANEGAKLALADINLEGLNKLQKELQTEVYVEKVDITDANACKTFVDNVAKTFGKIDVLVNNAGTALMGDMETFPEEIFRKHAELMMYAPVRLTNLCIPHFKKNGWGSVVNTASVFGKQPGGLISYDTIKAADIMITKDYSSYCAPFNVNVNAVCPGPVDTPLWHANGQLGDQLASATGMDKEAAIDWFAKTNIPMGRYAKAEEIASATVFLSSVPAHYITGVALNVDGGMVKCCL